MSRSFPPALPWTTSRDACEPHVPLSQSCHTSDCPQALSKSGVALPLVDASVGVKVEPNGMVCLIGLLGGLVMVSLIAIIQLYSYQ
jgi:hypothetical protein